MKLALQRRNLGLQTCKEGLNNQEKNGRYTDWLYEYWKPGTQTWPLVSLHLFVVCLLILLANFTLSSHRLAFSTYQETWLLTLEFYIDFTFLDQSPKIPRREPLSGLCLSALVGQSALARFVRGY